jgi:hypothetical protein
MCSHGPSGELIFEWYNKCSRLGYSGVMDIWGEGRPSGRCPLYAVYQGSISKPLQELPGFLKLVEHASKKFICCHAKCQHLRVSED